MKKAAQRYDVCIIGGAGHVGLPLGVTMALGGLEVVLLDTNTKAVATIKKGVFPFKEEGGDAALRKALKKKTLTVTSGPASVIRKSDTVVLVIGTPVDEYLNPQFKALDKAIEQYLPHFKDGQTLILRSTIFPGTTERLQHYFDQKKLKVSVAFCPERVVEGKAIREIQTMPQIISAMDPDTLPKVKEIFGRASKGGTVVVEPLEAELAKLYCNAWRYITFAVANQFYMMATDRGADYRRVYHAMTEKYDRMKVPRPGFAAGPCLFKDTMQLAAFNQNRFFLGHSAMLVNEGLPRFVIEHIKHRLCNNDLHEKTIGILGMTFKAESDDTRDSLSFKIRKMAELEAKAVYSHDYYWSDHTTTRLDALLRKSDIIIVATPHARYAQIPKAKFKNKIIVDIWNHLPHTKDAFEI